jgi:hypothetical protein
MPPTRPPPRPRLCLRPSPLVSLQVHRTTLNHSLLTVLTCVCLVRAAGGSGFYSMSTPQSDSERCQYGYTDAQWCTMNGYYSPYTYYYCLYG